MIGIFKRMSRSQGIPTIVFDLDGTLLNTLTGIANSANDVLLQMNKIQTPLPLPTVQGMVGDGAKILMQRMLQHVSKNKDISPAEIDLAYGLFMERYSANGVIDNIPYPNVIESLKTLKGLGIPFLICTNKPETIARMMIKNTELISFFNPVDKLVTGAVPGLAQKPHKDHVLRAFELAGLEFTPSSTIVVGDGVNDILVAHELKCKSIAVTYGFSSLVTLQEAKPTVICDSFSEAIDIALDLFNENNG